MNSPTPLPAAAPAALWRLKLALFLNYFVFALLLNSVGTVILQVQRHYGVSASAASVLEACKDLSIAAASFLVASFLTRFGYRRAMLVALGAITLVCLAMPLVPGFAMTKLLFVATGVCFALIKVSVYATIGLLAPDRRGHASLMSFLESFFMVGILGGYFLFAAFVDDAAPGSAGWLRVYYVLAALTALAGALLLITPLDESAARPAAAAAGGAFTGMLRLALTGLAAVFMASVFLYVLIEQSIMSWLPTFNSSVLHLPATLSIQLAGILAASTALGRFLAGFVLRRVPWFPVLAACLVGAAALVLLALPLAAGADAAAATGWRDAPLAAFVFPLIGLFLAPIYPVVNSAVLSALPLHRHAAMSGLSVIFSALGGTTGSLLNGRLFEAFGGRTAFYFSLVPLAGLLVCLALFNRLQRRPVAA